MSKDTQINLNQHNNELFIVQSANEWIIQAKKQHQPKKLVDILWHEGEIVIMFADTGAGKSIVGVQTGDHLSRGNSVFPFCCETSGQPVVYCDFELSAKQFEVRYSVNGQDHYEFSDNFLRLEINPDAEIPEGKTFEEMVFPCLEHTLEKTGAKILIVDNLTYLRTGTETAKDALPLMKILKRLKSKYGLSILVLAHTPKRDMTRPITVNDLQGSKMLINFCDAAFAIGHSTSGQSLRYIKQVKARNTEILYDADNVILCKLSKPHNFTKFEFIEFSFEADHLKQRNNIAEMRKTAKELSREGKSLREIADNMGISHTYVSKLIKKTDETLF
jgi:RecA-family ATPase